MQLRLSGRLKLTQAMPSSTSHLTVSSCGRGSGCEGALVASAMMCSPDCRADSRRSRLLARDVNYGLLCATTISSIAPMDDPLATLPRLCPAPRSLATAAELAARARRARPAPVRCIGAAAGRRQPRDHRQRAGPPARYPARQYGAAAQTAGETPDCSNATPIDGKSQGLALTPAGAKLCEKARAVIESFEAELLARIPPEHRDHLLPALNALWS